MSRSANFTIEEIEFLIDLVVKYKNVIENKETNAITWKQKNQVWERISTEFNANGSMQRTSKTLRMKYESIKKGLKKKCALLKRDMSKTGGGCGNVKDLLPYEERTLSITQLSTMGMETPFDSDVHDGNRIK